MLNVGTAEACGPLEGWVSAAHSGGKSSPGNAGGPRRTCGATPSEGSRRTRIRRPQRHREVRTATKEAWHERCV